MEKFAIDLDKVLDDFEFNEDCAEQIASVTSPITNATLNVDRCGIESSSSNVTSVDGAKLIQDFEVLSFGGKHENKTNVIAESKSSLDKSIILPQNNYHKDDSVRKCTDSINHFHAENSTSDHKITQKQCIYHQDPEPISITIYNNTSQTLLTKQQNSNNNQQLLQNRYDKKLNQPNIKPTVSNVFNSLNEYINAPTISLDYVDSMLDKQQEIRPKKQTDTITEDKIVSNINTEVTDHSLTKITTDKSKIVEEVHNDVEASVLSLNQDIIENKNQFVNIDTSQVPKSHVESSQEDLKSVHMEYKSEQADEDIDSDKKEPIVQPYKENIQYEHIRVFEDKKINDSASESVLSELDDACKLTDELYTNIIVKNEAMNISNEITMEKINESHDIDMNTLPLNSHESKNLVHSVQKPIGFNNINDDLSEEELNKYLETLEIEENLTEGAVHPQNALLSEGYKNTTENNTSNNTFSYKESKDDKQIHLATNKIDNSQLVEKEIKVTTEKCSERSSANKHDQDMIKEKVSDNILHDDRYSRTKLNNFTTIIPVNKEGQIQTQSDNNVTVKNLENPVDNVEYVKDTEIKNQSANETQNWSSSEEKHIIRVENNESEQSEKIVQPVQSNTCTIQNNKDVISSSEQNNNQISELQILGNTSYDTKDKSHKLQGNKILNDIVNICTDIQTKSTDVCIENNTENNENTEGGSKAVRPQTLDIASTVSMNDHPATDSPSNASKQQGTSENEGNNGNNSRETAADLTESALTESIKILGKQPPFWIPDSDASSCMLCDIKFTVLKRRHHCRACGKVLCNKCCNMKYRLEYQGNIHSRVCVACYQLLMKAENQHETSNWPTNCVNYGNNSDVNSPQGRPPNPNNPMEYCSTIPPLQQLAGGLPPPPPTVMVPVGVLKREGSTKQRSEGSKSVMFSDELDSSWDLKPPYRKTGSKRVSASDTSSMSSGSKKQNLLPLDPNTNSYIPQDPNLLPPTVTIHKGQISYHNVTDQDLLYRTLKNECEPPVMFAINKNLYAYVKITNLSCCVNRICWNVTSKGLACVGQDEIILLLETLPDETQIPKDLLMYINHIYIEATKGNTMTELSVSIHQGSNLLGSREHAGFLFIRQTLQCLQKIVLPPAPFLVGLLIHRWETPWAKVFPLRLVLRLGAEYRYYPCPLVSVRFRDALYFEIGHTVMKVLADFRNFGYTLPGVRGLTIHLKNRTTDVMFPRNRYDQVIKGLNNSNDHVLAFASNFSITADSHLVCIQTNTGDESSYQTQAINIQNKPRTVTGASFIVINGALKSSMGLSAKSSIVEDGLMVEIMPEKMEALKAALKNMHDFSIGCGRQGAAEPDETVNIKWVENDVQFNLGVKSPIDGQLMDGVPSIRVHNATDYRGTSRFIRWTEVFIIKSDDHPNGVHDPMDINKLSESIARATCAALVKLLDLLATAGLTKIGVRTTIHPDNVGYEAGSEGAKLPPIYMNSLDNELIQILHKAAQSSQDTHTVLELIFYVLDE